MILGILFGLFLVLIVFLLWTPIVLCIDTVKNEYYAHFKGLAKANFIAHEDHILVIELNIFFLHFQFYPLQKNIGDTKKNPSQKQQNKKHGKMSLEKALRILKSFKVKRLLLNIDTGDCIYNAKIYPLVAFLNYKTGGFNINFNGKNQLVIYVQNTPLRIIKSIINR